jgi:hypothetical protein
MMSGIRGLMFLLVCIFLHSVSSFSLGRGKMSMIGSSKKVSLFTVDDEQCDRDSDLCGQGSE